VGRVRGPGFAFQGSSWESHERPQLASIVHAAFDTGLEYCGDKTLGRRWTCGEGEGYIKTRVPRDGSPFILCAKDPPPDQTRGGGGWGRLTQNGTVIGNSSIDQRAFRLAAPRETDPEYQKLLAGKDAQAYYATCRDAAGERFFDAFQMWDANGTLIGATQRPKPKQTAPMRRPRVAGTPQPTLTPR
jgi:hypothetical protein